MQILDARLPEFDDALAATLSEIVFPAAIEASVATMLQAVREDGDAALTRFAHEFDAVTLAPDQFRVTEAEVAAALASMPATDLESIRVAHENVAAFARERMPQDWQFSPRPGVTLGERYLPLERVAAYIPGGNAPLVSTVLHTLTMAEVAGVPQLVATTKAQPDGSVNPAILAALHTVGCTEIYRLGGVYAIGALAFGTPSVPRVDKIVGPGNAYVTAAKRQVYGYVALDLVAGPSEVLIIADDSAPAPFIAADMLAQAEHGSGLERAYMVSTSDALIDRVQAELIRQTAALSDPHAVERVLKNGVFLIRAADEAQAVAISNRIAPEHLEVMTRDPDATAANLRVAGAIFIGPWTPEPIGDFVAGPSHVLPTAGAARYFSGLTVDQFFRRSSLIRYDDRASLAPDAAHAMRFADMELLQAHRRSVAIRLDDTI